MPPPELPRDAPVGRLLERVDREPVLRLGVVADAPLAERLDRRRAELLHRAPPLERDQRLDARVAALARPDRVAVRLALLDEAALLGPLEHPRARLLLREPGEIAGLGVHPSVGPDHDRLGEPVRPPDLEVESGRGPA